MINLQEIILPLRANAAAIRALVEPLLDEQARWKPNPDAWCMKEVMEHVYNEERIDFRMHLKEMLSVPPQSWGSGQKEGYLVVETCRQALEAFLSEREASLAWLAALEAPDWEVKFQVPFGPLPEIVTLSAADVRFACFAHDYLHLRQMNELLFAWNEKKALPFSVQYAGGW